MRIDFGAYRALFLNHGVPPTTIETMSLYELNTMMKALMKQRGINARVVSEEEWEQAKDMLKAATLNDKNVQLE